MSTSANQQLSRTARKKRSGPKVGSILLAVFLIMVAAGGAWAAKTYFLDGGQPKNILLMGVDEHKTRTDVVMLARIDPRQGIVNLISIPRDTYVEIPCDGIEVCQPLDKLAHAHAYGGEEGPELAVATVEKFLGVQIDGYARVDFDGFKQVIDTLGGVDMVIEEDMDYEDPTPPGLYIHFKGSPNPQHLTGKQALEYVRFRADGQGDVGRTERTRKFLLAVYTTLKEKGSIGKLPQLWSNMSPYVKTDLDGGTIAALARVAGKVDPNTLKMEMVPGKGAQSPNGLWVWEADQAKTQELVNRLIHNPTKEAAPAEEPKK
ncbi:MAG: putative transcriptional regulator [Symbiobacteriaceae bacterium]|nr:putative transcriptional regulator [Symbiobacteriaceae bacterium]